MKKPRVLVLIHYFLPSSKSGGPVRSISNLVDALKGEFEFSILNTDRDAGDETPYSWLTDEWMHLGYCRVKYLNKKKIREFFLSREFLCGKSYEELYINSIFDFSFSIFPLLAIKLFGVRFSSFSDSSLIREF